MVLNRLTKATSNQHSDYEYAYDKNGNIDWKKINGIQTLYTYDTSNDRPNRLTAMGGNNISHDANGNMTQNHSGDDYSYDHRNQIAHVDAGSSEEFYDYDAGGRRVYKRVVEGTPYVEDFDDGDIDDGSPTDWYTTGSYWDGSSGELKWTSSASQSGQCSNPDLTYDDFTAEFDLMADGYYQTNYWAAFAFRKTNYSDWYNSSGYMVYYRYNGSIDLHEAGAGVLATSNTGLDLSTWRHVKIVTSGSSIIVYVDGNLEISHTDGTYTGGYFGLNVFGVAARYDDLVQRPPDSR